MANESGGMRVAKFYACYVGCNALEDLKEWEIYIKKKKTRKCPRISKLNLKDKQIDYLEFFFG